MYRPLQTKSSFRTMSSVSLMPSRGENLLDLPQLLDTSWAQKIINYIPQRFGLEKRKGLDKIWEVAGNYPVTLLVKFTSDVWIFGYNTTIAKYTISTDAVVTIKGDFGAGSIFDGDKYGDYFMVCNGIGKIWRMNNSTFTLTEIANSPTGTVGLTFIGPRCYAWYEQTVQYSEVDTGTNPPFDTWSNATTATAGGKVVYRNAGDVRSVLQLAENTVVFSDNGFFSFTITTFDSAGTLTKTENIGNYVTDFGGATGAISTPTGIYYVNESGLWYMIVAGATDQPLSRQQQLVSTLLGSKYFEGANQINVDLVHDAKQKCIFVTLSKNSDTNNFVIGCKLDQKNAMFQVQGWNINRFAKDNQDIYGGSSVSVKVYKCFEGYDDDGLNIGTDYQQELKMQNLWSRNKLKGGYIQGFLNHDSEIYLSYNIYTIEGRPVKDKRKYLWTSQRREDKHSGYDASRFDRAAYDGGYDLSTMVENFSGNSARIANFQRLSVRITSGDKLPHIVNWLSVNIVGKSPIRRRDMTKII